MAGVAVRLTKRLTKRLGSRTALHELSFTAQSGEVVGLLVPNSAGKTTAIRPLTTLYVRPGPGRHVAPQQRAGS
jgi:ABC-type multidrug transport system ATPase subunit